MQAHEKNIQVKYMTFSKGIQYTSCIISKIALLNIMCSFHYRIYLNMTCMVSMYKSTNSFDSDSSNYQGPDALFFNRLVSNV